MVNFKMNLNNKCKIIISALIVVLSYSSYAEEPQVAEIEAEGLLYDNETGNLLAEGNVEVNYGDRYIKAKKLEYNYNTKEIIAQEGVEFKALSGNIFKADSIVVDDRLQTGELSNVKAQLQDGSAFDSEKISIIGAQKYSLKESRYSPCKPCGENDDDYLWNVHAERILYDEEVGRVFYRNATVEVMGYPILYTPYISHPTPFAKSKTGFLTPTFGRSSEYGVYVITPYYYNPKPNLDFTFSPRVTQNDGVILDNEFRHLFDYGRYEIKFSGAYPDERDNLGNLSPQGGKKFRGHVDGFGYFDLTDYWRAGFDAKRASDDTYLQRYDFAYEDVLTSSAYLRRIKDRDYFVAKTLSFQGLRQNDDPDTTPYVLPEIEASKTFILDKNFDQKLSLTGSLLSLRREIGAKVNSASSKAEWSASHILGSGHKFDLSLSARTDFYSVGEVATSSGNYNGSFTRFVPEAALEWSYPVAKQFSEYNVVIEPITKLIISDSNNFDERIPNEDSQNLEIYDYNLFSSNHISGTDLVENGTRVNYGMRSIISSSQLGDIGILIGQNYRLDKDVIFNSQGGLQDNFSDFVGRVTINNNIDGLLGNVDRQEIYADSRVKIDDTWTIVADGRRNMDNDSNAGWVHFGGGFEYSTDCMKTLIQYRREFTRDRDVEPSSEILFKVSLQNLGS